MAHHQPHYYYWPWVTSLFLLFTFRSHGNVTRELILDVTENIPEGTLIGTITGPSPPYLIVGTDTTDLVIDQSNGEIRTKVKLDREVRDLYSFVAIPLNGEGVRVSVRVSDINDYSPAFASPVMNVEFPENTPRDVKRTLQPARDKDLGLFNTQRYVISGGNVNNAFRLASHRERDGVLYLDLQVNGFLDRETTPFYNLVIDAYDGGVPPLKGSMTVHVTLIDLNDNSPIFNQSRYFATIAENVTTGTAVLQVFATDTDAGVNGQVSYAINRRQTDKDSYFNVDPSSGVISVNRPLDFETKEVHELVVIARDGGLQPLETTVFVSIRVLDISDHQPTISLVFLTKEGGARVSEGAHPGEFVARVSVSDPDDRSSGGQDYSGVNLKLISGGRGHFQLEKRSEGVYLMIAPRAVIDREKFPEYALTLVATDPMIPTLNASVTVRIVIEDENDSEPMFSDSEFYGSVDEVAESGTSVMTVYATDADEGMNSVIRYELQPVKGSHSDWFKIDPVTGIISTQGQVDCEKESMPRVTVVATDGGNPPLSSSATVFIQVRNINDNEPVFDHSFYNVSVSEDAPLGKCILKVSATDPDCGINAIVNYKIRDTQKRQLPWTLNASSGELCISAPLDFEQRNVYELSVMAADAGGLSSTAVVRIQLLDVNDNDPIFYSAVYETTVLDDSAQGAQLVTVKAMDVDTVQSKLKYAITQGNDAGHFEVHPDLGIVTLRHRLQKTPSSGTQKWELTITATDGGGQSSETMVVVNFSGPNSRGPLFGQGRYTFKVSEDAPINFLLGSVTTVPIGSASGKVRYSISSGDDNNWFKIDLVNGEIRIGKPLDYEKVATVLLNVVATQENLPGSSHAQVEIQILNVNDNSPQFESAVQTIWVAESAQVGSIIYSVRATDLDDGDYGRVEYRLLDGSTSLFRLDPQTGDIRLLQALDFETVKKHELLIGGTDAGKPPKSANCTLIIDINDINDCTPKFESKGYTLTVLESLPIHSHLIEVHAEDEDTGNNGRITYHLSATHENEDLFGIFPVTGILYLKGSLDRESRDKYDITVVAQDHGIPPLSVSTTITLIVADSNDNDPVFVKGLYIFSVDENQPEGCYVGELRSSDVDIGDNGAIRYFLQEDPLESAFEIDGISGIIRTTKSLDREKTALHELQVVAHDLGHPQRQAEVIVHVKVNDLNDFTPRIVEPEEDRLLVREEQPEGTEVTKIMATDSDNGDNGTVVYGLLNEDDFSIDPGSGVVRTKTRFNYDLRSTYTLNILVRDLGVPPLETIQEYRVEIVRLDDSFHQTQTSTKFTFEVAETAPIGHLVGSLRRGDEEESRLTFALIQANSADGTFELDKRSGKIYLGRSLDYEVTSEYSLQVRLNDPSGPGSLRHVTILVLNENDEPPRFPNDPISFSIPEDTPVGTGVWNLSAVDLDRGVNGVVHYSLTLQAPEPKFRINTVTGRITLQETVDHEKESSYILVVTATDQALDHSKRISTSVTIHVSIDDLNDNYPKFVSPSRVSVLNGEKPGSWIHTITAVDLDGGVNGQVTYDLIIGSSFFSLNRQNGHLYINNTLSMDMTPQRGPNILNISATDGGSPPKTTFQQLQIFMDESHKSPPRFEKSRYMAKVSENSLKGTPVVKVSAVSKDQGPQTNNTVLYVLPEASSDGRFGIQPSTGFISILSSSGLDRETESEINLTIYAMDMQMTSVYDTTTVNLKINEVNDHAPSLYCPSLVVPENQALGVIHTLSAWDPDFGRSGELSYSITQGNPENIFSIDLHGGQLKSRPLDRERRGHYILVVTAQDQGLPVQRSSCNVSITVTDENDNSAEFLQKEYKVTLREDSPLGSTVLIVEATDADIGINAAISYALNNVTSPHFRIDNKKGAILVSGKLDREKVREYSFEVVATDGGIYDSRSTKARVTVTLTDVNDNRPVFTTPSVMILEVSGDTKPGTKIGQVVATDRDSGVNGDVTYALESGSTKFRVNSHSGVITVGQSLESDAGRVLNLKVIAKDQGIPALAAKTVIQVLIGQVPIAATLRFTQTTYQSSINENSPQAMDVVRVTALRNDGRRQKMLYEIIGGNEDGGFELIPNSGQIRVKNSTVLDREHLQNFTLLISAQTDGGSSAPLTTFTVAVITLLDENDCIPEFNQDIYTVAVWEGNSKGAFVIMVSASDDDVGSNSQLMYYIVDGNEDNAFVIDPPHSGIVKTNIVLDREIQEEYSLTVVATDDGTPQLSGTCLLKVKVIDLNDNPSTFPPMSDVNISEASTVGSLVTTMVANDVDTHPDLVYTFDRNPGEYFSLGKYDGRIWLMKQLDYEQEKFHELRIRVSDSVHETFTRLKVNVLNANDNRPHFSKDVYEVTISDQTEVGTEILQVHATDADGPQVNGIGIKYSLQAPNFSKSRALSAKLRIDESSGKIFTNDSLKALNIQGFVELTIIASDNGIPALSSRVTLWLNIRVAETELFRFSEENFSVDIPENATVGTVLLKLDVNYDRQRYQATHFHYAILEGNSKHQFAIGSHNGELLMAKRLESNSQFESTLTVALTCVGGVKCTATTTIVLRSYGYPFYFSQSTFSVTVSERKPIGSTIFKIEPPQNNTSSDVSYTLTSGVSNGKPFELSNTGTITLREPLDYEKVRSYKLIILASSGSTRSLLTLDIVLEDWNDHVPHFVLSNYLEFVPENEPIGTPVFTARAIDPDGKYGQLTYSILETSAHQKFTIDGSTGLISTATVFDYETLNRFHFTLRAVDSGGLAATVKVQVEVNSRDEYAPIFRQNAYRWTIPSNAESGYLLGTVRATDEDQGIDGLVFYTIVSQNGHFRINRTTGTLTLKEPHRSDLNTSLVILASSGQLNSKSATVPIQVTIGPPSAHSRGSSAGFSDWLIGLLGTILLLLLLVASLVLIFYLRRQKNRRKENPGRKMDLSYPVGGANFDTLAYTAHSTMLAGASSRPTSIYSPQYSDLAELGRRRNPGSELSEKSGNSASSGRGSAEEEDDEEIRMINEGRLREQKLRESMGMLPDSGMHEDDEDSIKNTQEYLARLGVRPIPEDAESTRTAQSHPRLPSNDLPFDLSLIYAQIPDEDECDQAEGLESLGQAQDDGSRVKAHHHSNEELGGSYSWDYLQHWGPQYQPLAHVFSEIARLNEDVASGHYSGVIGDLGSSHEADKGHVSSSCNNSTSGKSDTTSQGGKSAKSKKSAQGRRHTKGSHIAPIPANVPLRGPLPALPILPRSPITADLSYSSPLSPSFSPELSFCNSLPVLPEHNVGIRTAASSYPHPSYASSDSSEMRI